MMGSLSGSLVTEEKFYSRSLKKTFVYGIKSKLKLAGNFGLCNSVRIIVSF